jgi:hypothetical protein
VVFFTYLQKERSDLLNFHAVGGDKWATVHGWLYYTGRVKDQAEGAFRSLDCPPCDLAVGCFRIRPPRL